MTKWNRVKLILPCVAVLGFVMLTGCAEKSTPESSTGDETTDLGESTELGEPAEAPSETTEETEVVELSAEDKALVEAQMFCPSGSKLGGMGTPVKVMHEGNPVFLCCEHCREGFLKDPEKGLATIEKKKQEAAAGGAEKETEKEAEPAEKPAAETEASS